MGICCGAATRSSVRVVLGRGPESLKLRINYGTEGKTKRKKGKGAVRPWRLTGAGDPTRGSSARLRRVREASQSDEAEEHGSPACCLLVASAVAVKKKRTQAKGACASFPFRAAQGSLVGEAWQGRDAMRCREKEKQDEKRKGRVSVRETPAQACHLQSQRRV